MSAATFSEHEWQLESDELPPLGAHLVAARRGYSHHAIYVGNGRVVHYSGFSRGWRRGPVEEVALGDFTQGRSISARFYASPRFDAGEIVARARSRLAENSYHLLNNNCEHLCEWCVLGTGRSRQVEQLRDVPRQVVLRALSALRRWLGENLGADPAPSGWAN